MSFDIEREVRNVLDDEPAPPPPPEPKEDDDGHQHFQLIMPPTLLTVYPDGSVGTDGWRGTALAVAFTLAAFVVIWQALQQLGAWVGSTSIYGVPLLDLTVIVAVSALAVALVVWALWCLGAGVVAICRWWRGRRTRRAQG